MAEKANDHIPKGEKYAAHFDLVDLLRGFAALTVLFYHAIERFNWSDFPDYFPFAWFRQGWMGVDIFFVISGFVITWSALKMKDQGDDPNIFLPFMGKRLARIAPLHYLTVLLFAALSSRVLDWERTGDILSHLLFIHNWFPAWHRSLNPVNWSLGPEMQFYILIAIAIPFINAKNLKYFAAGALAITFAWRFWAYASSTPAERLNDVIFMKATQLPGMLDLFAAGILLAFFLRADNFTKFKNSRAAKLSALAAIILLIALASTIFGTYSSFWPYPWMVLFFRTLLAIIISLIILLCCAIRLNKWLKVIFSPLLYIGTISYGIYLFHWPVLQKVNELQLSPPLKLLLSICLTFALAALSWHFFEKKFLCLAKKIKF